MNNLRSKSVTTVIYKYHHLTAPPHFVSPFYPLITRTKTNLALAMSTEAGGGGGGGDDLNLNSSLNAESESSIATAADPSPTVESPPAVDEDREFGFKRDEMYSESFPKSVDPYDRHVFLSYKAASTWPSRVEDLSLPSKFALALKKHKDEFQRKTRFAVIEGGNEAGIEDGDVLIFPEMIRYRNLTEDGVDAFVEEVLVKEASASYETAEKLKGFHVFVCAHANRDKRCGVCGPILVNKLREEIENGGFKDVVFVSPCSHVGGHKYAGNVIIFGPNSEGKVMGHWYGYVTPQDVPILLEQHIGKGEVVERLWRGEVCQPYEKNQEHNLKPQPNNDVPYPNGTHLENNGEESQESINEGKMQNGGGCCQGANGFTCCRDDEVDLDENITENKPREGNRKCAKEVKKISAWLGRLEQADVLVGVAVIGVVASIAVGYSIYRRSG